MIVGFETNPDLLSCHCKPFLLLFSDIANNSGTHGPPSLANGKP
jgi:hypothetical protein